MPVKQADAAVGVVADVVGGLVTKKDLDLCIENLKTDMDAKLSRSELRLVFSQLVIASLLFSVLMYFQ